MYLNEIQYISVYRHVYALQVVFAKIIMYNAFSVFNNVQYVWEFILKLQHNTKKRPEAI